MGQTTENQFYLLGISHKTAPVEIRETVSLSETSYPEALQQIADLAGIAECVLLSTCNRTEVYAVISDSRQETTAAVEDCLIAATGAPEELRNYFYRLNGTAVIEHLFRVAAGIDSMILGEPQIFGQVKAAYSLASDALTTGPTINRLFHHSFKVGKQIRNMTAIGEGAVSVSFAAVEKARQVFSDLKGKSVLLIGAGKTGELSAKRLRESGIGKLMIANRTMERAEKLAKNLGGSVVPFERFPETAAQADIVISSVAAGDTILDRGQLAPLLKHRNSNTLLIIDLGVPRNIDHQVGELDSVTLLNVDDLEDLTAGNLDRRKVEAGKAEKYIADEVEKFSDWLAGREIIPVIRELHDSCEAIRVGELEKMKNRVDNDTLELLDLVSRRIVRKILHNPVVKMRDTEDGDHRSRLVSSIRTLFMECTEDETDNESRTSK